MDLQSNDFRFDRLNIEKNYIIFLLFHLMEGDVILTFTFCLEEHFFLIFLRKQLIVESNSQHQHQQVNQANILFKSCHFRCL